jgi:predicted  nucleic acid-binding Zn-ribbon protein
VGGLGVSGAEGYDQQLGPCPQCCDELAMLAGEVRCGCCGFHDETHPLNDAMIRKAEAEEKTEEMIEIEPVASTPANTITASTTITGEVKKVIQIPEPEPVRQGGKRR